MGGMIVWSAFGDPVVLAILFGMVACFVIAWVLDVARRRTAAAGSRRWSKAASGIRYAFLLLGALHLGTSIAAVQEVDASGYALVLTTIQVRPEMVPAFRQAMKDGRMSTAEYWNVRRHGGLATRSDMRDVSRRVAGLIGPGR